MIYIAKLVPVLAVVVDALVGDPRVSWHPVVLIGKLIAWLEKILLHPDNTSGAKKLAGLVLVAVVLAASYCVSWAVLKGLFLINSWAGWLGAALLLSFTITPRSLAGAGREIKHYLDVGDLVAARDKVSWVVGRDTDKLDESEITRATVETVAENIVDGIISPLFYAFIGGVALAYLYRAVNTLDSMVGYKNNKYIDFGMAAARIDDCFNYIPARITGLLVIFAALLADYDAAGAARAIWRDAAKHPSPNSGLAEAGVAGALGLRLGGYNYYGGQESFRAYMGQPRHELRGMHIAQTINIMYIVTITFIFIATLLVVGWNW